MDSSTMKVNFVPCIGPYCARGNAQTDDLLQATLHSCERHGAYKVRAAALQQMEGNSDSLANVDLAAYKANHENLLYISNLAFDHMSDEEKHIEFCEKIHITPWLFL